MSQEIQRAWNRIMRPPEGVKTVPVPVRIIYSSESFTGLSRKAFELGEQNGREDYLQGDYTGLGWRDFFYFLVRPGSYLKGRSSGFARRGIED